MVIVLAEPSIPGRKSHITPSINRSIKNVAGLIRNDVYKLAIPTIKEDIQTYHRLFPAKESICRTKWIMSFIICEDVESMYGDVNREIRISPGFYSS